MGRQINKGAHAQYSTQLNNKGKSKIAFTERDHAAGYIQASNKIQKKAYRSNTQSRQVDGLYNPEKFAQKVNMLNHTRVDFNILLPQNNRLQNDPKEML